MSLDKPTVAGPLQGREPTVNSITAELDSSEALTPAKDAPHVGSLPAPEAPELEFRKLLGEGGMGRVFLAHDSLLGREVAVKELAAALAPRPGHQQAFLHEARTVAGLTHAGIVPVHALTTGPAGRPAFTMQVVAGETLRQWMRHPERAVGSRQRLDAGLEILLKVGDALAYAHSRGILHCDIKPDNVMVGQYGSVHLMDWGLARRLEQEPPSSPCGTPEYMSPEQARNEPLDERSDVFSLGAVLFELVCGKPPYGGGTPGQNFARAILGNVEDIFETTREVGISRRLCKIIKRAVAPRADDRYPSISALCADVHAFIRAGFHLPRRAFAPGSMIVEEGQLASEAYLLVSGRCRVFRAADGPGAAPRLLGPGDIFGELALLLDGPRTASVQAIETCTVLVIERKTIEACGALEGWLAELLRVLARRFRELEQRIDAG